jgi:hypothetical protein
MEMNAPQHRLIPEGDSAETRSPAARLLTFGSFAAFVLALIGIPATILATIDYQVGHAGCDSADGCLFGQDSPAVSHDNLVRALSVGGLTIALFALAVLLGVVEMRQRRLPLHLIPGILLVCGVTVAATVLLFSLPAARAWAVLFGVGSVVVLSASWVRIQLLLRRAAT